MKRNIPMRTAGALFLAAMFTTCMVAGTYAKYTSSMEIDGTARIAKFGITANISGSLFGEAYKDSMVEYDDTSATVRVTSTGKNIVAPGTKNDDGMSISIAGVPEVDVNIQVDAQPREPYMKSGFTYAILEKTNKITAQNIDEYRGDYLYRTTQWNNTFVKVGDSEFNTGYIYWIAKEDSFETLPIGHAYYPLRFSCDALTNEGKSYTPPADDVNCETDTFYRTITNVFRKNPFSGTMIYWHTLDYIYDEDDPRAPSGEELYARMLRNRTCYINSKNNVDVAETLKYVNHKITWKWNYDVSERNNKLDTIMAVAAAENSDRVAVAFDNGDTERITGWDAGEKNDDDSYDDIFMGDVFKCKFINTDAGIDIVIKIEQID